MTAAATQGVEDERQAPVALFDDGRKKHRREAEEAGNGHIHRTGPKSAITVSDRMPPIMNRARGPVGEPCTGRS